ncbi:MAG TPA: DivIVA domain-containing protein [Gaiellaceae bacterium]|nr:DivIVA domain-containing protein [Gaiellaceae bacterium]
MTDESQYYKPGFRLRPLGYSRRDVEVAFAEGRMALHQLREQSREQREWIEKLDAELERSRGELEATRAREHEIQRLTIAAEQQAAEIEEAARDRARAITAAAEERATSMRTESALRAEEVSRQIDELLRVREQLVRAARGAAQRLDEAVTGIERGDYPLPADPPRAPLEDIADGERGDGDGRLFDPVVEVDAGPFGDFAELSTFERALGRMPKVQDVYIRRFADERATIELTLVEAAPVVDLLHDVLPNEFDVVAATAGTLKITVAQPVR